MNDPAGITTIFGQSGHSRNTLSGFVAMAAFFSLCATAILANGGYCPLRPYLFHYSSEQDCHSRPWARRLQAKLNPPRIVD